MSSHRDEPPARAEPTGTTPPARPRLRAYWDGGTLEHPLPQTGTVVLGRASDVDVRVDHRSVSRRHAAIHVGDDIAVEDLGSANGTRVGGRPVAKGARAIVYPGDAIEIGSVLLVIHGESAGRGPASVRPPALLGAKAAAQGSRTVRDKPRVGKGGEETAMERVERLVRLVAGGTMNVLLAGEPGTGKGVLAARIHAASPRAGVPLASVRPSASSPDALERELFGAGDAPGVFEATRGGTVFLDEVADLPPAVQARLLDVIEKKTVVRLGDTTPRPVDVRFIAATCHAPADLRSGSGMRADLHYRLCGVTIELPPLRARREDIPKLARDLLERAAVESSHPPPELDDATVARLVAYDWPGNMRELESTLERALLLGGGTTLDPSALPVIATAGAVPVSLRDQVASAERERIAAALEQCAGNQTQAAKLLGISRRTLVSRLSEYNLPRPRAR